ncbi:MAG TPA: hypothetical protein VLJ62_07610 [Burkholderiaceae bacterium]|nr:hypothetical protein [Burkholderiaceae bacterium]
MNRPAPTDVIAGLSLPSFMVVASALTLMMTVLAGQSQPDAAATPAATRAPPATVVRAPERQRTTNAVLLPAHGSSAPRPAR